MPLKFKDILEAFEFGDFGGGGEQRALLSRETGTFHFQSDFGDIEEELPDDIDDENKYVEMPKKRDLDLGKPLVLDFARQFLPDDYDDVRYYFGKKGAYARFKDLLGRRNALAAWYDFEAKAQEKALREWCADEGIEVEG